MAIVTKGVFSYIDNMLMNPITKTMDNIYCALAAQLKEVYALYNIFMATLCLCPRFIITGYKNR
ncbi:MULTISPECIES: hypothetical protein [unclassified Bartonella]|uniref:hypothetical protein n=1 Tax=unclassified Bartonella TaxID=2645622 RepID=UPI0035CF83E7